MSKITKECCCWGCDKQAEIVLHQSAITSEDIRSAVVLCDGCGAAECDPFEVGHECRANSEHCVAASHNCGTDEDGCCLECGQAVEGAVRQRIPCPRPECNGDAHLLGVLGRLAHYRCRACGIDSNSNGGYE